MLPLQQKRMREQLSRWGYSSFMIERMEPIRIVSCFYIESTVRGGSRNGRWMDPGHEKADCSKVTRRVLL